MFRAPYFAHLPHFSTILDNVPGSIDQKAKLLGISPATLRKYRAAGQAPKAVHLALFWESVWGIALMDSTARLHASTYFAQAQALQRANKRLTNQIALLEAELAQSQTGPANLPVFRIG